MTGKRMPPDLLGALAALSAMDDDDDDRPDAKDKRHAQEMCGAPETQADRLTEFWSVYSSKGGPERFATGQLVRTDPKLLDYSPYAYPADGYPAVVSRLLSPSTEPPDEDTSSLKVCDIELVILVPAKDASGEMRQVVHTLTINSRFLEPWPAD